MAGIKLHAALDVEIRHNHIHHTCRGLWLDWMAQGTRVAENLFHDNQADDLFVEVNHGPFLVDHNIFLSGVALRDWSQGGAYAHNLIAGRVVTRAELSRLTPFHLPHSTQVAGLKNIAGGDNRFFNNVFAGDGGLSCYDDAAQPVLIAGNVFLNGAAPSRHEPDAPTGAAARLSTTRHESASSIIGPQAMLVKKADGLHLEAARWNADPTRHRLCQERPQPHESITGAI